jgi:hypothetical protein
MRFPRVALAVCIACGCQAQDTRSVVFRVTDPSSANILTGLKAEEIQVIDGGSVRPVSSLRFGLSPMDLVLVLDLGSDTGPGVQAVVRGALLACSELDEGDRLGLVTFSTDAKVQFPLLSGGRELASRIESAVVEVEPGLFVRVYDALLTALGLFSGTPDPSRTREVVIVTNSPDRYPQKNGSKTDPAAIIEIARQRRISIFGVVIPPAGLFPPEPSRLSQQTFLGVLKLPERDTPSRTGALAVFVFRQLRQIAESTGGETRAWEPTGYVLRQSFERARKRYIARYVPSPGSNGNASVQFTPEAAAAFPDFEIGGAW